MSLIASVDELSGHLKNRLGLLRSIVGAAADHRCGECHRLASCHPEGDITGCQLDVLPDDQFRDSLEGQLASIQSLMSRLDTQGVLSSQVSRMSDETVEFHKLVAAKDDRISQ